MTLNLQQAAEHVMQSRLMWLSWLQIAGILSADAPAVRHLNA